MKTAHLLRQKSNELKMLKERKRKRRKPMEEKTQMIMMIEKEKFQNRRRDSDINST